jgi:hypothetical protein
VARPRWPTTMPRQQQRRHAQARRRGSRSGWARSVDDGEESGVLGARFYREVAWGEELHTTPMAWALLGLCFGAEGLQGRSGFRLKLFA